MEKLDLKFFIDTDDDVRLSRRIIKGIKHKKLPDIDNIEIGKDIEEDSEKVKEYKLREKERRLEEFEKYLKHYFDVVKPAFEEYVVPMKTHADLIIPNYGFSSDIIDVNGNE